MLHRPGACAVGFVFSALGLGVAAAPAQAAYDRLVVFGDSLSDTGNVNDSFLGGLTFDSDNYMGRFSDGPVWVEHLATPLSVPAPAYSRDGGTNYAYGGATTGDGTAGFGVIYNLGRQLLEFTDGDGPTPDDLFIVWAGANDFLDDPAANTATPSANVAADLNTLIGLGATDFLVVNLPPLGEVPRFQLSADTNDEVQQNGNAIAHNAALEAQLDLIDDDPTLAIHRMDVFSLFGQMLADPGSFGFTNTTDPARESGPGGEPVPDASGYVFWDDVHPTTAAHAVLGQTAYQALTSPTAGDTNLDLIIDPDDIDLLRSAIGLGLTPGAGDTRFDLDASGGLSEADVVALVESAAGSRLGDANLDGQIDEADLQALASNWRVVSGQWAAGDFDGSGLIDEFDLSLLATNWNFGVAPALATSFAEALAAVTLVPEPNALGILVVGWWLAGRRRRGSRADS